MEQYIVSARKYRPSTFATVVGQSALTSTLKNAIASNRLAHAYLFCGSRGVGKTSCARIFAKTINCTNLSPDGEACNECDSCKAFNDGNSMNIIELDAASHNGIDDIKTLIEQVQVPPSSGRYRVFIIDEVHMLSSAAFNAFLKTLEEPPSYAIFILATTEKHKIIPTILSRCQIYDFNRITINDMVNHLSMVARNENIAVEPSALNVIARQADGAMRDALSIFDQVAASSRGNITYQSTIESLNVLDTSYYNRLVDCFVKEDIPGALLVFHEVRAKGFDAQFFLTGLGQYMRDLMLASDSKTIALLDAPDEVRAEMKEAASKVSPKFLYAAMGLCNDADLNYRQSSNKQLLVELTLIRIAQLLSPSPADSGRGEGLEIRPIAKSKRAEATATPTTTAPAATNMAVKAAAVASEPTVQYAASPTPNQSATTLRVGSLSIASLQRRKAAVAAREEAVVEHRSEPYTEADVLKAWAGCMAAHPTEHVLVGIMDMSKPSLGDNGRYSITVGSGFEADHMREHLGQVLKTMRDLLKNDDWTFDIQISDEGPAPMFWNERQVLDYMLENYPRIREFYKEMKLSFI